MSTSRRHSVVLSCYKAVSFSRIYIFSDFSFWDPGRNLGQNSNNNLWGFGQNYKITNMPSISVTQHVDTHSQKIEISTTYVPHKYTQSQAKPSQAQGMIRWYDIVQYSCTVLLTADCCMLCLMSRFICVFLINNFNLQACSLVGASIPRRNSSILGVHKRPACRTLSVLYVATVQLERQLF